MESIKQADTGGAESDDNEVSRAYAAMMVAHAAMLEDNLGRAEDALREAALAYAITINAERVRKQQARANFARAVEAFEAARAARKAQEGATK